MDLLEYIYVYMYIYTRTLGPPKAGHENNPKKVNLNEFIIRSIRCFQNSVCANCPGFQLGPVVLQTEIRPVSMMSVSSAYNSSSQNVVADSVTPLVARRAVESFIRNVITIENKKGDSGQR